MCFADVSSILRHTDSSIDATRNFLVIPQIGLTNLDFARLPSANRKFTALAMSSISSKIDSTEQLRFN